MLKNYNKTTKGGEADFKAIQRGFSLMILKYFIKIMKITR